MYVQRCGGVAACLDVRGKCHCNGVEAWSLLDTHVCSFNTQRIKSEVLRRLRFACGIHHPKNIEACRHLHRSRLGLLLKEVTVDALNCWEGPVTQTVGQSPAAVHSQAILNGG